MKIHSNYLSAAQLEAYLADVKRAGRVGGAVSIYVAPAVSRSRSAAWEVWLYWCGEKRPGDKRRRLQGRLKAVSDSASAAFYDEWRWWLARLFLFDPDAICGTYRGAADFHAQTRNRFGSSGAGSGGDAERQAAHVPMPPGAARHQPAASLYAAERLADEREQLEWWAGQSRRVRERSQA